MNLKEYILYRKTCSEEYNNENIIIDRNVPLDVLQHESIYNYYDGEVVNEFLSSVDSSIIINELKQNFESIIYNIEDNTNNIKIFFNKYNLLFDIKFKYIISKFNYTIHSVYHDSIIIEKAFPKQISSTKFHKYFHITERYNVKFILNNGLRPKFCKHEIETHLKLKQDKTNYNKFGKIYFLAFNDDELNYNYINGIIKESIKTIFSTENYDNFSIIEIKCPPMIIYKDSLMNDKHSYFTYNSISNIYLKEYTHFG